MARNFLWSIWFLRNMIMCRGGGNACVLTALKREPFLPVLESSGFQSCFVVPVAWPEPKASGRHFTPAGEFVITTSLQSHLGNLPISMDASTPPHPHWLRICGPIRYLWSTHCMWRFWPLLPALCQRVAAVQIWLWLCYYSQATLSNREDKKCIQFAQITAWR